MSQAFTLVGLGNAGVERARPHHAGLWRAVGASPTSTVRREANFQFLADHPAFVRLLGWETLNDGRLAGRALVDVAAAEFETLHGILRRGVEQGIFRADLDIPKTVMSLTALCFGFFNRRSLWATLWNEDLTRPEALDAVLDHILVLAFQGIRTSPMLGDAASTRS